MRPAMKMMAPSAPRSKKVAKKREARCHNFSEDQKLRKAANQRLSVFMRDQFYPVMRERAW